LAGFAPPWLKGMVDDDELAPIDYNHSMSDVSQPFEQIEI